LESRTVGLDDRVEIGIDRVHGGAPEIAQHNRTRALGPAGAKGHDGRLEFVHLGRDVGLQGKQAVLLVGVVVKGALQLGHQPWQPRLTVEIGPEIVLAAERQQEAALPAFGILDGLVDGGGSAQGLETRDRFLAGLPRLGFGDRETEPGNGGEKDKRDSSK
jgi:hypothetical protein